MAEAIPIERLRVLLVEPDRAAGERLAGELSARGLAVELCEEPHGALRALRERGADAVLLATPLGDADWIAAAAAVKEGPAAPALVILDAAGQGHELLRILPADRAPDAVLAKPVPAAKLLVCLGELLRDGGATAGPVAVPTFPELLVELRDRRESGVLEVRADGVCTRVALRDGAPVFAEGGSLRETLGRMLLRHGALSEADYLRVIERMTERLIENEATRMGEVLVELGLLAPAEVFEALSVQVQEKIVGCFRWPHFAHAFEPYDALPDDVLAYACPPLEALVLAGMRAHFGLDRLEPLLAPHAARRAELAGDPDEIAARFRMTPAERRLLRGLDGSHSLEALRVGSALDSVHTAQCLAALAVGRAIAWRDAEPRAVEAPTRPRLVPRVRPEAPAAGTAASPAARSPAPVPEPREGPRADPARMLARLRSHVARAEKTRAVAGDGRAPRIEAERAFRQGMRLLEQSALPGALRAFTRALEISTDEPEYRMFEAWVEYLVARGHEARALARAKATACAQRMLERDRESVRAWDILGQLAYAAGEFEAAERHFRAALRASPDDHDAQRGLRLVERRR